MPGTDIDWVLIKKHKPEPIGAIGFIGDKAVSVIAFYDDKDSNKDGKLSIGEKVFGGMMGGSAVVEVAMQARVEPDIVMRDSTFNQMATNLFLNFARDLVIENIYKIYFKRGVSMGGRGLAKIVTSGAVKEFVVRKGFEKVVGDALKAGMSG